MMKLKNVWNVILKVLTHVRTHPEELLVPKIWFCVFWSEELILDPYYETKQCLECHPESSYICKNSSQRTPRSKNLIFLVFWVPKVKNGVFDHMKKLKMSGISFWKFSPMCKNTSRRNPRSKNLIFVIFHLFSQKIEKDFRTVGKRKLKVVENQKFKVLT